MTKRQGGPRTCTGQTQKVPSGIQKLSTEAAASDQDAGQLASGSAAASSCRRPASRAAADGLAAGGSQLDGGAEAAFQMNGCQMRSASAGDLTERPTVASPKQVENTTGSAGDVRLMDTRLMDTRQCTHWSMQGILERGRRRDLLLNSTHNHCASMACTRPSLTPTRRWLNTQIDTYLSMSHQEGLSIFASHLFWHPPGRILHALLQKLIPLTIEVQHC